METANVDWVAESIHESLSTILIGADTDEMTDFASLLHFEGYNVVVTRNTSDFLNRFNRVWRDPFMGASLELIVSDHTSLGQSGDARVRQKDRLGAAGHLDWSRWPRGSRGSRETRSHCVLRTPLQRGRARFSGDGRNPKVNE